MTTMRVPLLLAAAATILVAAPAAGTGASSDRGAHAAAKPTLKVSPSRASPGTTITYSGRHWRARSTITLLIGPPNSEADRFSSARTSSSGTFRKKLRLPAAATPGKYVVLACRLSCRVKAQANLTITGGASMSSRAPTSSESKAIRRAALRSLTGSGWKVSHIRVSKVSGRYRYAKAAVDNTQTGIGGEMLLRGRNGSWKKVFLGTDGFCDAPIPKRALNDLGFDC